MQDLVCGEMSDYHIALTNLIRCMHNVLRSYVVIVLSSGTRRSGISEFQVQGSTGTPSQVGIPTLKVGGTPLPPTL